MKYLFFLFNALFIIFNLFYLSEFYSQNILKDYSGPKYFKLLVDIKKNPELKFIRNDLELGYYDSGEREFDSLYYGEYKLGQKFQCIIDIRDSLSDNQNIYVCNYSTELKHFKNVKSEKHHWYVLTTAEQQLLLNWSGNEKSEIESNDFDFKQYFEKLDEDKKVKEIIKKEKVFTNWKYFKIYAKTKDDSIFSIFQEDIGIDPILEYYTIIVDIADPNPQEQFVSVGDENDPSASKYAWLQLSKRVQNGLINWRGKNKINLNQEIIEDIDIFSKTLKIKSISNALKLFCYYKMAQSYIKLHKYRDAITNYSKCIDLGMNMLSQNSKKGYFSTFPITIKDDLSIDHKTWTVWHSRFRLAYEKRAEYFLESKEYSNAIKDYSVLLMLDTLKIYYYRQRSKAFIHIGEYQEAISDLKKAIELCNFFIQNNDDNWSYYINNESGIRVFSETDEDNSKLQYEKHKHFFESEINKINCKILK